MSKILDLREDDNLTELIFGKKAIVMFWRLNGGCVGMDNNLKAIARELSEEVVIVKVELFQKECEHPSQQLAIDHDVKYIPTVILLDGGEKARIEGGISSEKLLEQVVTAFGL